MDRIGRRQLELNRRLFIHEIKAPPEIKHFMSLNKKLTRTERQMSAFMQSCVRYGYVKHYRTQQIIQLGTSGKYIIADFFLLWPEVIIEVDGPEHISFKDKLRDAQVAYLFGYQTLRVSNKDVQRNNADVRTHLIKELAKAEGLSPKKVRARVKEYWQKQTVEGYN